MLECRWGSSDAEAQPSREHHISDPKHSELEHRVVSYPDPCSPRKAAKLKALQPTSLKAHKHSTRRSPALFFSSSLRGATKQSESLLPLRDPAVPIARALYRATGSDERGLGLLGLAGFGAQGPGREP